VLYLALFAGLTFAAPSYAAGPVFVFQNNFWVNLHHFLRGEARRRSVDLPLELPLDSLGAVDRAAWERALDVYAPLVKVSIVHDKQLVRINNALAQTRDGETPHLADVDAAILQVLNAAAPIYRIHGWSEHSRDNAGWIASHGPAVQRHAGEIRKEIARALQCPEPGERIVVDLAGDIGPNLAYTVPGGIPGAAGHTVIAPQKNAAPETALDTLSHEISHTLDRPFTDRLYGEAERQQVEPPQDLWHTVTLYTTWQIAKRVSGHSGAQAYGPDAVNAAMFEKNGWSKLLAALRKDWQPYLDGHVSFEAALRNLIRDTAP
jgi:hypothetical protein